MGDFVWACTSVYGPNDNGQRPTLWEELSQVRAKWPMAWCLVGDFNIIKYPIGLAVSLLALLCSHSRIL